MELLGEYARWRDRGVLAAGRVRPVGDTVRVVPVGSRAAAAMVHPWFFALTSK